MLNQGATINCVKYVYLAQLTFTDFHLQYFLCEYTHQSENRVLFITGVPAGGASLRMGYTHSFE